MYFRKLMAPITLLQLPKATGLLDAPSNDEEGQKAEDKEESNKHEGVPPHSIRTGNVRLLQTIPDIANRGVRSTINRIELDHEDEPERVVNVAKVRNPLEPDGECVDTNKCAHEKKLWHQE